MQITKITSILLTTTVLFTSCSIDDDNNIENAITFENNKVLGSSSRDLLSEDIYTKLTLEIVSVQGSEPESSTLINLQNFLSNHLHKSKGIHIRSRSVPSSGLTHFDIDNITKIENNTRQHYTNGKEITVYIYFADGSHKNDTQEEVTLGSAYKNTSIVMYKKTIANVAKRVNAPVLATIESATLQHEFAHLLGLVNINSKVQSTHEDPDHKGHCNSKSCLMSAYTGLDHSMQSMLGNGIPTLDAQCIADLKANGGK